MMGEQFRKIQMALHWRARVLSGADFSTSVARSLSDFSWCFATRPRRRLVDDDAAELGLPSY